MYESTRILCDAINLYFDTHKDLLHTNKKKESAIGIRLLYQRSNSSTIADDYISQVLKMKGELEGIILLHDKQETPLKKPWIALPMASTFASNASLTNTATHTTVSSNKIMKGESRKKCTIHSDNYIAPWSSKKCKCAPSSNLWC